MNRRQFIGTAGAALAAGALATPHVFAAHRGAGSKKAVGLGMVTGDKPLAEKFRIVKAAGFDGIEMDAPNGYDPKEVIDARDRAKLPIHAVVDSVHWKKTLGDPDAAVRAEGIEGLKAAISDAKTYGASAVLLVPAVVNKQISYEEAYRRSQEEIRKAIPFAEKAGVKIAVENVWNSFLLSPLEFASYIDAFKSPWVGAYFDAGNIVNYGWPEQWIRILGPRILRVHVKGFSRTLRDKEGLWAGFKAEIGEDEAGWPDVRKALRDVGYNGWITAEVNGGDESRLREVALRLDEHLLSPA